MNRRSKITRCPTTLVIDKKTWGETQGLVSIAMLVMFCLSVIANPLQARSPKELRSLSSEEVQKIEKALPEKATVKPAQKRKLLVFWLCEVFFHKSIPVGNKALELMGEKTGAYEAVFTNDYSVFTKKKLKQFDAVCFNNTTHLKFDPNKTPERCNALIDFIKSGKGIVGIHSATDNFYDWPEGQEMMGGKFTGHPWRSDGTWAIKIDEPNHPLTAAFEGKGFKINDEIYRTDPPLYSRDKQFVLMSLDMSDVNTRSVEGLKPSDMDTGISWIKTYGKGRLFYCSLGHNDSVYWNPQVLQHILDGIQFALGDLLVSAKAEAVAGQVDTKPKISSGKVTKMKKLLKKIKTYDWGQSREALTEFSDKVRDAYGKEKKLKKIEDGLLGVLNSDATRAGKQFACRQLSIIGTERSIPTLAKMLPGEETSDMARYALERIPDKAVDDALRDALPKAKDKPKVGIINSLGERQDKKAVSALCELIYDSDAMVAEASAAALGKIADSETTKVLAQAKDKTSGKLQLVVLDAYLKCADKLAAEGEKAQALTIYKELQKKNYPEPIRKAALRGMLDAAKEV